MGLKHVGMVAAVVKVEHGPSGEISELHVKLTKLNDTNKPRAFIQVSFGNLILVLNFHQSSSLIIICFINDYQTYSLSADDVELWHGPDANQINEPN